MHGAIRPGGFKNTADIPGLPSRRKTMPASLLLTALRLGMTIPR